MPGKFTFGLRSSFFVSRCLIYLWEQCIDIRNELLSDLSSAEEGSGVLDPSSGTPRDSKGVADLTDRTKKAIEIVKKCRYPFESYYKKQSQLIQELSTVPKFDVSPLKTDLTDVQKKFTVLGNALTAKLNSLESQVRKWIFLHHPIQVSIYFHFLHFRLTCGKRLTSSLTTSRML